MDQDLALVRAAHVLGVVLWIGGVGFVTTVLLPAIAREHPPHARLAAFHRIERRFAWQARGAVLVTGASGLWLAHAFQLWERFADPASWWLAAMVLVWLVFAAMLFVLEPLVLPRVLARLRSPATAFRAVQVLHGVLLALSLLTLGGAVAGAHGFG